MVWQLYYSLSAEETPPREIEKEKNRVGTFFMMGSTASVLLDEDEAAARPFGMCESGTRMGLCRRMDRFFCDLPMVIACAEYQQSTGSVWIFSSSFV
jgi:hypothetical protein